MSARVDGPAMSAEMNVTPMIDVLLVLLIIFMLTLPRKQEITLQLPDPRASSANAPNIVLEVLPGGNYRLNQQPFREAELGNRIRAAYAGRPDKRLSLKGDPTVRYQDVIIAMDSARGAGVRVIGIHPRT